MASQASELTVTSMLRFLQHPEYMKVGTRLLFREGRTKGVGLDINSYLRDAIQRLVQFLGWKSRSANSRGSVIGSGQKDSSDRTANK